MNLVKVDILYQKPYAKYQEGYIYFTWQLSVLYLKQEEFFFKVKYVLTIIFLVKNSTRRTITFNTDKQPLACYVHLKEKLYLTIFKTKSPLFIIKIVYTGDCNTTVLVVERNFVFLALTKQPTVKCSVTCSHRFKVEFFSFYFSSNVTRLTSMFQAFRLRGRDKEGWARKTAMGWGRRWERIPCSLSPPLTFPRSLTLRRTLNAWNRLQIDQKWQWRGPVTY